MNTFKQLKKAFEYRIELNLITFIAANLFLLTGFIFYVTDTSNQGDLAWGLLSILIVSIFIYHKIIRTIILQRSSLQNIVL